MMTPGHRLALLFACSTLAACGGGGGGGGGGSSSGGGGGGNGGGGGATTYTVGGTVTGLDSSAAGLVLQNNAGSDLTIAADGSFTFPTAVAVGGAYAVTIKTQPSVGPLQSCSVANGAGTVGTVAVTNVAISCTLRYFKYLYVMSSALNGVYGYAVNATNGSLSAVPGSPVLANGSPRFATGEPTGKFFYVTNSGPGIVPTISGYAVDATTGALAELDTSPFDLSATPPPASAIVVPAIHRSGAFGYVSSLTTGQLFGGTINSSTGELTEIPSMPVNIGPEFAGFAFDSSGQVLFTSSDTTPGTGGQITSFLVNSPSGVLSPVGTPFPTGGNNPSILIVTPQDNFLLTLHPPNGTLAVFAVQKNAGTPTGVLQAVTSPPVATGAANSRPLSIAFNRRNNIFYVTNIPFGGAPGSLATFQMDAATGNVTPVGTPIATNDANGPAFLAPSGRFLFQYNTTAGTLQTYSVDQTTGVPTLLPIAFTPVEAGPYLLFPDPSGRYLYVVNVGAGTVSSYSIDATTGAFTLVNTLPTGANAASIAPFRLQ